MRITHASLDAVYACAPAREAFDVLFGDGVEPTRRNAIRWAREMDRVNPVCDTAVAICVARDALGIEPDDNDPLEQVYAKLGGSHRNRKTFYVELAATIRRLARAKANTGTQLRRHGARSTEERDNG